jgi:hypothetical protein
LAMATGQGSLAPCFSNGSLPIAMLLYYVFFLKVVAGYNSDYC